MAEKHNEREGVKFMILMYFVMLDLVFLSVYSIAMFHTLYIAILVIIALLAYAVLRRRVTGTIAALMGISLLILVAFMVAPSGQPPEADWRQPCPMLGKEYATRCAQFFATATAKASIPPWWPFGH